MQLTRSINGSSAHTSLLDYELFDESGYGTGTSPANLVPIVILVQQPLASAKKAPRTGHRLKDVIGQMESTPEAERELRRARQWVAQEFYKEEPGSLQALRLSLGLSQTGLAKLASTTQTRISKIENGDELPRFDTMKRLADALTVDMNTLARAIEAAAARKNS